jgi:1,4-alpha-glucan branching enzyme
MALDKAYDYMDWPRIEDLIYSEEKHPKSLMAPRQVKEGTLYQCFFPNAKKVRIEESRTGRKQAMAMEDENGYFVVILPQKKAVPHTFIVDGVTKGDPYCFDSMFPEEAASRFGSGVARRIYRYFGAHTAEADGLSGTSFAVWAPNASRVSVAGDFNGWDGRANPMEFHEESGIFELFIPFAKAGDRYVYEIKLPDGLCYTRPDPYGFRFAKMEEKIVSVIADLSHRWHDRDYLTSRAQHTETKGDPLVLCECSLRLWAEKTGTSSYPELAEAIASYAESMGYTHVELTPVMEYPDEQTNGYQTGGYFAPSMRYGEPAGFKKLIDILHGRGIGVILDFTPGQFTSDTAWLASYDGTSLFEHLDPRQGRHPIFGSCLFNYGRPEVRSFLTSSAFFWMREYHADGLRLDGVSTMLRLDYGRAEGQWVPNMYGSSENLDGISFLKAFSAAFKNAFPEGLLILEEDTDWPKMTWPQDEDGFGFDYKWNLHFTEDVLTYLRSKPAERTGKHSLLTNGMLSNFYDQYILSLSRGIGPFSPEAFLEKVYGSGNEREALIRCAYGYLFTHPGKKLLTDGEDRTPDFLKDLIGLYKTHPALSALDMSEDGFEWINTMDSSHSVLSYLRKTEKKEETLLVVCNFSSELFSRYQVGVPFEGKYKEIFNSDHPLYGGSGIVNKRARASRKETCDERTDSLYLRLAPCSIAVFEYREK